MQETEAISQSDAELIKAIRGGRRDLFERLVDRHSPAVFGIAWSRLGDHSLAEEAAQETFIKAYRTLGMLRAPEKFTAWLSAIARHVAINLGIRQRRELLKRARWKVELEALAEPDSAPEDNARQTGAALEEALAELPAPQRETLVLFYLEKKSVAEAAIALGISEAAFKTRLHRARERMRSVLESRLETSLEQMRPRRGFSAAVMLALPLESQGSLAGGTALAALLKALPFHWLIFGVQLATMFPAWLFARWLVRKERENLRDSRDFRARNLDQVERAARWMLLIVCAAFALIRWPAGTRWLAVVSLVLLLPHLRSTLRRLVLLRNRYTLCDALGTLLMIPALAAICLGSPEHWVLFVNAGVMLLLSFSTEALPRRMDRSLFLRAAEDLLPAEPVGKEQSYARSNLWNFSRFLMERHLILDWLWRKDALILKLNAVTPNFRIAFFPWFKRSTLTLGFSGTVEARLSETDRNALATISPHSTNPAILEERVAQSARAAFAAFTPGRGEKDAERLLGEAHTDSVYRQDPARSTTVRARVWIFRLCALSMLAIGVMTHRDFVSGRKMGVTPVTLTADELRAQIEETLLSDRKTNIVLFAPFQTLLFPERAFFTPAALAAFHRLLLEERDRHAGAILVERANRLVLENELFQRAFLSGLITPSEFEQFGTSLELIQDTVRSWSAQQRSEYLGGEPIHVSNSDRVVVNTTRLHLRLTLIDSCGLLSEFDLAALPAALRQCQLARTSASDDGTETAEPLPGGLFLTWHSDPLRDTYESLSILQKIGALDIIDTNACIEGLARLHLGYGLFKHPEGPIHTWSVNNTAQGEFNAFESLRILNASNRVRPESWKFRKTNYGKTARQPWDALENEAIAFRLRQAIASLK